MKPVNELEAGELEGGNIQYNSSSSNAFSPERCQQAVGQQIL